MAATEPTSSPDWCSLPTDAITCIAELLPSHADFLRFRSVCRSFRSITPPLSPEGCRHSYSNLKIPIPDISYKPNKGAQFILSRYCFYAFEPVDSVGRLEPWENTWLLMTKEHKDGFVSAERVYRGSYHRPKYLNLSSLKFLDNIYDFNYDDIHKKRLGWFNQVVVSDDESVFMTKIQAESVHVWRKGDENWTRIYVKADCSLEFLNLSIVYHKGNFIAFGEAGALISINPKSLDVTEIASFNVPFCSHFLKYLVKSSNDLFLVTMYEKKENKSSITRRRFLIFKLDEETKGFVPEPNAFRDKVVFIGDRCSFSVPAMEFPKLRRNCIYFFDDSWFFFNRGDRDPRYFLRVFDFDKDIDLPLRALPYWMDQVSKSCRKD